MNGFYGWNRIFAHWNRVKRENPGALVLFRAGDYYEAFGEDADKLAAAVGLTLMRRADLALAGFPYHALNSHLATLVAAGHRVAICEQV